MRIEGIVFDLDGTLIDTLKGIGGAVNEVLSEMGFPAFELESYRALIGGGPEAMFEALLERIPLRERPTVASCMQKMERFDFEYWVNAATIFEGIEAMLERVAEMGIPTAVVTNKRHHVAAPMVAAKFGAERFVGVYGAVSGVPMKPDPAGTARALRAMGSSNPERVLFLGDTEIDMETALRAGCIPVGAEWGFRSKAQLLDSGARAVLGHPLELMDLTGVGHGRASSLTERRNAAGDTPTWR